MTLSDTQTHAVSGQTRVIQEGTMADCQDSERQPYDYQISDPEDFMLQYRYTLVNVIEVEQAIPWLKENHVLDKMDEEMILFGYKTSVLKAGDLIDIVLRRGPRAFNLLVEFLEFEYPEIFKKIMGKPARTPDPNVYIPLQHRSTHLSQRFRNGVDLLFKALEDSRVARKQAQRSIEQLQEKIEDIEAELEMKQTQILDLTEKILELDTHNKELALQKQEAEKERNDAVEQQKILREERDQYRDKGQESVVASIHAAKKQSYRVKRRPKITSMKTFDEAESKALPGEDEIKKLKNIITEMEKRNDELSKDNKCLEEQLDILAEQCDLFDSCILAYKDEVKSLKEERDQVLSQFENLKVKHQTLQEENGCLKKTIMNYQTNLRLFKNEKRADRAHSRRHHLVKNQMTSYADHDRRLHELEENFSSYYGSDTEDDRNEPAFSSRK